jgi:hypothetical protein
MREERFWGIFAVFFALFEVLFIIIFGEAGSYDESPAVQMRGDVV